MSEAETAMKKQNYKRALANIDTAIARDTANTNAKAYMMKARILRQMADSTMPLKKYSKLHERAYKAEQKAIEIDPGKRSSIKAQRLLTYRQKISKGAKVFNQAAKSGSKEDYLRAAALFSAAGAVRPDSTAPIRMEAFSRIRAAENQKEMKKVIPLLEEYIKKAKRPTKNVYTILAQLYLREKQLEKTINLTERAIDDLSSRPTHFRIQGTKDVKYASTIEVGGSSRSVEGAIPDRIKLSTSQGKVSGRFTKKKGGNLQTKGRLRVSLYKQGTEAASGQTQSPSDTVKVSANLSEVTPLADLRNLRINALNRTGDTKRAIRAYRKRIKKKPNNATYRYNYGSLLSKVGRYDEAIEQLKKAVELDPKDPKKQYNLGVAYSNRGKAVHDSLLVLRDSVRSFGEIAEKEGRAPTKKERKIVNKLSQKIKVLAKKKRTLFKKAIPPLERARRDSQYRQRACSALLQAYVQTEQMKKAQSVKKCAQQSMKGDGGGS
ncbi:MAG: tetratricopeptide repeat protein [Salinibacter sp.]